MVRKPFYRRINILHRLRRKKQYYRLFLGGFAAMPLTSGIIKRLIRFIRNKYKNPFRSYRLRKGSFYANDNVMSSEPKTWCSTTDITKKRVEQKSHRSCLSGSSGEMGCMIIAQNRTWRCRYRRRGPCTDLLWLRFCCCHRYLHCREECRTRVCCLHKSVQRRLSEVLRPGDRQR